MTIPLATRFKTWRSELSEAFAENPTTMILIILLIIGGYQLHEESKDLQRLCDLTGAHDTWVSHPITPREKIDDICLDHDPDEDEQPDY
jgi:hypothetical protein